MGTHAFSPDAHHNRSLRMQLRAVWCLRLIGDTEGPTLIAGATWLRGVHPLRLLGTPTSMLTQGDIRITILSCAGKVKVGVEAPDHVEILRGELKCNNSELTLKTLPQL